jgi:3-hydroxyisobutyrate dehydrogenase-like beta-hydroxyacid dehydrogenase
MAHLGFIGLGVMGSRMVQRLLDAGHTVTGYNRTQSKAQWLLERGMQWGETPAVVARAVDMVFSMMANTAALQAVMGGADGVLAGLQSGTIFVDMSTVSPMISRTLAMEVAAAGAHMLDAPVSGSVITLEEEVQRILVGIELGKLQPGHVVLQVAPDPLDRVHLGALRGQEE